MIIISNVNMFYFSKNMIEAARLTVLFDREELVIIVLVGLELAMHLLIEEKTKVRTISLRHMPLTMM
jgi:hypothetical protein